MVLTALSQAGGEEYIAGQVVENPRESLTLLGKPMSRDIDPSVKGA
jgi:hypothetical protein